MHYWENNFILNLTKDHSITGIPNKLDWTTIEYSLLYFQLRYLQTLNGISAENNSTIIFPVPIDIMSSFMQVCLILSPLFIINHLSAVQHRPNHSKHQTARDVSKLSSASTADVWIPRANCKCFSKGKDKWIRIHIIAFPMIINHWNE